MVATAEIKELINLSQVSRHFGLQVLQDGSNTCPFCGRKKKLSVYDGVYYKCHHPGCQKHGDIFSYLQDTNKAKSFKEARQLLLPLINKSANNYEKYTQRSSVIEKAFSFYEKAVNDEVLDFLNSRGFINVLENYAVGYAPNENYLQTCGFNKQSLAEAGLLNKSQTEYFNNRVIFAIKDKYSRIVHLQGRSINPEDELRWLSTSSRYVDNCEIPQIDQYLFNLDKVNKSNEDYVLLTEGVSDGLSILELDPNLPVVSCFGVQVKLNRHTEFFMSKKNLIVFLDNDRYAIGNDLAGQYKSWSAMLPHLVELKKVIPHLNIWCAPPPEEPGIKDVNDWINKKQLDKAQFINYVDLNMLSLEQFALLKFGHLWEYQPLLATLVSINKDPKDVELYTFTIHKLTNNSTEYILRMVEQF